MSCSTDVTTDKYIWNTDNADICKEWDCETDTWDNLEDTWAGAFWEVWSDVATSVSASSDTTADKYIWNPTDTDICKEWDCETDTWDNIGDTWAGAFWEAWGDILLNTSSSTDTTGTPSDSSDVEGSVCGDLTILMDNNGNAMRDNLGNILGD